MVRFLNKTSDTFASRKLRPEWDVQPSVQASANPRPQPSSPPSCHCEVWRAEPCVPKDPDGTVLTRAHRSLVVRGPPGQAWALRPSDQFLLQDHCALRFWCKLFFSCLRYFISQ